MTTDYEKQANDFLQKTNVTFRATFLRHGKYFPNDTGTRDIYSIELKRMGRSMTFNFGQSLNASGEYWLKDNYKNGVAFAKRYSNAGKKLLVPILIDTDGNFASPWNKSEWIKNKNYSKPSAYDVLTCLTKYDVGTFEDFCNEFGYDTDSRNAEKIYKSVLNEYTQVCMIWNEKEIEELREIQ